MGRMANPTSVTFVTFETFETKRYKKSVTLQEKRKENNIKKRKENFKTLS